MSGGRASTRWSGTVQVQGCSRGAGLTDLRGCAVDSLTVEHVDETNHDGVWRGTSARREQQKDGYYRAARHVQPHCGLLWWNVARPVWPPERHLNNAVVSCGSRAGTSGAARQ